ncbi:MAG: hypothetical protein RL642_1628, partial [Bacteroidota bacterium]
VLKYPNSFGIWANLLLEMTVGTHEILVLGPTALEDGIALLKEYIPNKVIMMTKEADETYPLMQHKEVGDETMFFVCRNYTCQLPCSSTKEVMLKVLTK